MDILKIISHLTEKKKVPFLSQVPVVWVSIIFKNI